MAEIWVTSFLFHAFLYFSPLSDPQLKKKKLSKPVSQLVSETLTIRESEVY